MHCFVCPFDDDNDLLSVKPRAVALWHEHQNVLAEREKLKARVEELERQVKNHNKKRFGSSTERNQGTSAATPAPTTDTAPVPSTDAASAPDATPTAAVETPAQKESPRRGTREQPHLETQEQPHILPEEDRRCDQCGGVLELWFNQTEDSPEIDVIVRGYLRRLHRRQKWRCRCGGCVKTAPGPLRLKEGSLYSIGFGVQVCIDKYAMHIPLHRQVEAMASAGLRIDSQTLWAQADSVAFWSFAAYQAIKKDVLSHPVIGADETTWRLMNNTKGADQGTEKWWIWLARAPRAVVYTFQDSRSADAGAVLLGQYNGIVMCDGYGAYVALQARNPNMTLAHCWSHIRRDYLELSESAQGTGSVMIGLIDSLFRIERDAQDKSPEALLEVRQNQSALVVEKIAEEALRIGLSQAPGSRLYVITKHLAREWEGLTRFLTNAQIPLHNNTSEQSARGPVMGRNNHQGSRSKRGTEVSAMMYTLVETAELCGLDPRVYLHLVVLRALRGQSPLLPREVTAEILVTECGLSASQASAAMSR